MDASRKIFYDIVFLPLPFVLSAVGPVSDDGVDPLSLVQSKLSSLILNHPHSSSFLVVAGKIYDPKSPGVAVTLDPCRLSLGDLFSNVQTVNANLWCEFFLN